MLKSVTEVTNPISPPTLALPFIFEASVTFVFSA
jgi:hypothetical protein